MIEATAWGQQPGFLIRDRDRSYGGDFIARARRLGIETILTPVHAPNANAIAERVIGTLRRECLDHVIAVNEQHLRRVLGEYVQHYNAMRPHRSLSLDSPEGRSPVQRTPSQRVVSKPVLGGLHHEYRWAAWVLPSHATATSVANSPLARVGTRRCAASNADSRTLFTDAWWPMLAPALPRPLDTEAPLRGGGGGGGLTHGEGCSDDPR